MSEVLEETVDKVEEGHHHEANWDGGIEPMGISYGKTMMWYFLLSDAFTFSAFLIAYGATRISQPWWPDPNSVFNAMPGLHGEGIGGLGYPMVFVSIMTFILILSSVFVVRAVQEGHRMNREGVMFWMSLGILGGVAFLACQAIEWSHLIHIGLAPNFNPFGPNELGETVLGKWHYDPDLGRRVMEDGFAIGPPAFGSLFFGITGFHGLHVFSGVCFNIWGFGMAANRAFERRGHYEMIEKLGLYWHFVDLVWVFVFLAFYLL
jgi:cytochrome c oxidase subunit 3